jgi:NitT/TauT family transport system substrate-binding protein
MANHPDIVRAFVRATIRGMADTLRKPQEAYALTVRTVPGLAATSRAQRATLRRALDFWRPEAGHPLGWIDPRIWTTTAQLLYRFKQIPHPVAATAFYTNRFVPGQ